MSKHTPGPWHYDHNMYRGMVIKAKIDDSHICKTYGWDGKYADEEMANAKLIAAAPDLLEALEKAVNRQGFSNEELIAAREVINKAKNTVKNS